MKVRFAGKSQARHLSFAVVVMLLGAVVCSASPITYNVNRVIGAGSVTGFIETDGSIGGLIATNIVDWSLTLNDGTNTFSLFGPSSGNNSVVYSQGADVSASATQLLFNFSGTDNGLFLFQAGLFSGMHYYCAATQLGTCYAGETVVPTSVFTLYQNASRSGDVVIGSTVPEPGSIALLGSGLLGVAGVVRRKLIN